MSSDGISPSGTFDTNTATRSATDTVPPDAIDRPIAADSGTPSSTLPSTTFSALPIPGASGSPGLGVDVEAPEPAFDQVVAEVVTAGAGEQPEHEPPATRFVERLDGELEGHRADQRAGAERHDPPDDARRRVRAEADERADEHREPAEEPPDRRVEHGGAPYPGRGGEPGSGQAA